MECHRLRFSRFAAPHGCFQVARRRFSDVQIRAVHRHDFCEVFWVEHGSGMHRIADQLINLSAGDVCCVQAEDAHGFGGGAGGMTIVNVAVPIAVVGDLVQRYGADGALWSGGPGARHRRLAPAALRRLSAQVEPLARAYGGSRERLALDRFLLELIEVLAEASHVPAGPAWLTSALATLAADPRLLVEGAAALPLLCGRTREHVARMARQHLGRSPRELVLELRLDHAARALRVGDAPILELALDAGFANLSHFHRAFRRRFGCTPLAFRRHHAGPLPG